MMTLTRQQAADAAKQAVDERDTMQANLLDLDGSFGKRLLAGAQLTGVSQQRWGTASAALSALWDMFSTYSGVVDRAAELAAGRLGTKELAEVSQLLTGPSVEIIRAPGPRRDLADRGRDLLSLSTARARMREPYQQVTDVVTAAENNWNACATSLDTAARALSQVDALGDPVLGSEVAAVEAELSRQRNALNSDPLGAQAAAVENRQRQDRACAIAARVPLHEIVQAERPEARNRVQADVRIERGLGGETLRIRGLDGEPRRQHVGPTREQVDGQLGRHGQRRPHVQHRALDGSVGVGSLTAQSRELVDREIGRATRLLGSDACLRQLALGFANFELRIEAGGDAAACDVQNVLPLRL